MIQRYSHRWYLSNDDTFDVYFRNENTSHGRSNRLIVGRKFAHEYHFNLVIAINRPAFIKSQFLLVLHWVNWKMTIGQMHKKKSNITMRNSTVCLEMSACQFSAPLKSWFSASFHVLHVLYDSIWLDTGACTMHNAHAHYTSNHFIQILLSIEISNLSEAKWSCDKFWYASIIRCAMNRADFWTWIILSGKQIKTHTDVFKDICYF